MKTIVFSLVFLSLSVAAAPKKPSCVYEGATLTVEREMSVSNPEDKKLIDAALEGDNEGEDQIAKFYLVSMKDGNFVSKDVAFSFKSRFNTKMVNQFKQMMREGIRQNPRDKEFQIQLANLSQAKTDVLAGQTGFLLLHKNKKGETVAMSFGPMMMPIPMNCKMK